MKIYVLFGTCGEYSDNRRWIVRAYESKTEAEIDEFKLGDASDKESKMLEACDEGWWGEKGDEAEARMRKLDPKFSYDYTGTHYYIEECELIELKRGK